MTRSVRFSSCQRSFPHADQLLPRCSTSRNLSSFAGELLKLAADLLREGLHTAEILEGYQAAYLKVQDILPSLVCHTVKDVRSKDQLAFAIKAVIGSKQYGFEVLSHNRFIVSQGLDRKISMTRSLRIMDIF